MAPAAAGLAPEQRLAGLGIAGRFVLDGRRGERPDVGDYLPGLVVRNIGWRHSAGQALLNRLEERFVVDRMPEHALAQVGPTPAQGVRPMAGGATVRKQHATGIDRVEVADELRLSLIGFLSSWASR